MTFPLRNLFDQYKQPENQLTHALVSALYEDRGLLNAFVQWITGEKPPNGLSIVEQRLPGEEEADEEDAERRGLPDAWIHNGDDWCLLVESKVTAPLTAEQLTRHYQTARRRGYQQIHLLALDAIPLAKPLPEFARFQEWRDVYVWLTGQCKTSSWAGRVKQYMEVIESRWISDGHLTEGTLTEFSGITFDEDNPYTYPEAKRLLKLMMPALRQDVRLIDALGIDPHDTGRGAIKGKAGSGVWDYLRFAGLDNPQKHTAHPHLTLSINREQVSAVVNVPSNVQNRYRRALQELGEEGFMDLLGDVAHRLNPVLKKVPGAYPMFSLSQRHFTSRNAPATLDAWMHVNLNTAVKSSRSQIKYQPQWLQAGFDLITHKCSNMEFQVGVIYPYARCADIRSPDILETIVSGYIACRPLLEAMLGVR